MICPKCQKTVSEDSLFCSECGYIFKSNSEQDSTKKSTKKITIVVVLVVLVLVAGFFINKQIQLSKVVNGFTVLIDDEQYKKAMDYYEDNIVNKAFVKKAKSYTKQKYKVAVKDSDDAKRIKIFNSGLLSENYVQQIEKDVVPEMESLKTKYIAEEISYDEVKQVCSPLERYENDNISSTAKSINKFCENLEESRNGFEVGMKAVTENKYVIALENLSKVIEEDANYNTAQEKIKEVVVLYKVEVMEGVEKSVASNDYSTAITKLESLKKYSSDSDVTNKLNEVERQKKAYDEEQERLKIEGYKNNQQVEVISTKVYDDGYYITMMKAEVRIRNNSNKTAKEVSFGLLLFDGNGYPVDVEYRIYQGTYDNEFNCSFNSCNVTAGNTFGSNRYYNVPDYCRRAKACVRSVEYTDGTTWTNPYYDYWVKANYSSY